MDDYIELADDDCPKCGNRMVWRPCDAFGCDDGYVDMYEYDDPLWFSPGDHEACTECRGVGHITWCQKCGYCVNEQKPLPGGFNVKPVWLSH